MKPPVPYYGGKTRLASAIVARFSEHSHYVEPFCGSLAVLLAKPRSKNETVNDLNSDLMTFWRVLRDEPEALVRACLLTPHSLGELRDADLTEPGLSDVERARRVMVLLSQGRSNQLRSNNGWRHSVGSNGPALSMPQYLAAYCERIIPAAERIAGVSLENRPAVEVIERYGRNPDALLYVDPPYLGTTRVKGYHHEFLSEAEHRELLGALRACKATVVLSGYDSEVYSEVLNGWSIGRFTASAGNAVDDRSRTEVLWSNRPVERG